MSNTLIATRAGWVKITLIETPPDNWGLRGGLSASEIGLGFKIDV